MKLHLHSPEIAIKRVVDFVLSAFGLVALSPLFLIIAVIVRLTSLGPAFFRQLRVGLKGRNFILLKFRTMTVLQDAEKGSFDAGSSVRVTRIGRVLRKTKLDELPQLWNVLKGDMALVGPRPEVRKWVNVYADHWDRILTVRPGITDPGAIEFKNEEDILAAQSDPETYYRNVILPHKLDLYEEYVQTRSFWGDLRILLRTVWTVIARQNKP
jgi:lipopolysaccharide/colanic/teichoic acid biosynthesis glycosyltransferase